MDFSHYLTILEKVAVLGSNKDHAEPPPRDERSGEMGVDGNCTRIEHRSAKSFHQQEKNISYFKTTQDISGAAQDGLRASTRRSSAKVSRFHDGISPRREVKSKQRKQTQSHHTPHQIEEGTVVLDREMHRSQSEARSKTRASVLLRDDASSTKDKPRLQNRTSRTTPMPKPHRLTHHDFEGKNPVVIEQAGFPVPSAPPEEWESFNSEGLVEPSAPEEWEAYNVDEWECKCPDFMEAYERDEAWLSEQLAGYALEDGSDDDRCEVDKYTPASRSKKAKHHSRDRKPRGFVQKEDIVHQKKLAREQYKQQFKKRRKQQHMRWFGHGKFWTLAGLVMAWMGSMASILSCRSTEFVRLKEPLDVAPIYDPVYSIGVIRVEICYNETISYETEGCETIVLQSEDVDDNEFQLARLFLTLGTVFGCFFTLTLSSSVYWESIDLRPIGLGYLVSYFLQSFSMLFFDTNICSTNKCRVGTGCIFCIVACIGWIGACVATAKMDSFKQRALRRRRREQRAIRRREREERKRKEMLRKRACSTARTDSTTSSNSSRDGDLERGVAAQEDALYQC